MKRFVEFYREELQRKVKVPIDITISRDIGTYELTVRVPEQNFRVVEEITFTEARIVEEMLL